MIHQRIESGARIVVQQVYHRLALKLVRDNIAPCSALNVRQVPQRSNRWGACVEYIDRAPGLEFQCQCQDFAAAVGRCWSSADHLAAGHGKVQPECTVCEHAEALLSNHRYAQNGPCVGETRYQRGISGTDSVHHPLIDHAGCLEFACL